MKQISPFVRFAMYDRVLDRDWIVSRVIFDYEIIYIDEGEMEVIINKQTYIAKKGDIIFLKPKEQHILINLGTTLNQPHVHFDLIEDVDSKFIKVCFKKMNELSEKEITYFRNDDLKQIGLNLPTILRLPNSYLIKEILMQIIDEYNFQRDEYELCLKAQMTELLINIKRGYEQNKNNKLTSNSFKKEELRKYIYENIDKNITLDDLANFVHLSKFYFINEFKKLFNTTPIKYINEIKADKAAKLILFTNFSINEIATQLSFDTQQSFCRWFKSVYKVSPLKYRNSNNC